MDILFINHNGNEFQIRIDLLNTTVWQLKAEIEKIIGICPDLQKLVFKGKTLLDKDKNLLENGISVNSTLYLARRTKEDKKDNPKNIITEEKTVKEISDRKKKEAKIQGMFTKPFLETIKKNPEMLKMFLSNPEMKEVFKKNPEFEDALTDPDMLEQMMASVDDPDKGKEVLRGQDLALSNIESMPNGFNMLRHVYETVANPTFEAMKKKDKKLSELETESVSDVMPNPWKNEKEIISSESIFEEEEFENNLKTLHEMGFENKEKNKKALFEAKGNINTAISILLTKEENNKN